MKLNWNVNDENPCTAHGRRRCHSVWLHRHGAGRQYLRRSYANREGHFDRPVYKLTRLPLNVDRYYAECTPKIVGRQGRPRTTDQCAPDFFPYVADPKRNDALMNLIGNHDYEKGGSEYVGGFSPPFQQKTLATFLVFAPMRKVTLVRVDDFEVVRDEERDIMSGVYLSIVGNKVVDQIQGCQFDRNYVCSVDGRAVARLTDSGKFRRLGW